MSRSWQETLMQSLEARDAREQAYVPFIQHYQRLAQSTAVLKERNDVLLTAAKSARGTGNAGKGKEAASGTGDNNNPVRAAYVSSLESQIASLKDELAGLYRTQSQNAQRLLSLSDVLRDTEDKARDELDQRKSLRLELEKTHRRTTDLDASLKEKEKMIVHLNDELQTVHLEFTQLEEKNKSLVKDNKNLLQRWLDRMNQEALQVNEANAFIESTRGKDKDKENSGSSTNGKRSTSRAASRSSSPSRSHAGSSTSGRKTPTTSTSSSKAPSTTSKRPTTPKLPPSSKPA